MAADTDEFEVFPWNPNFETGFDLIDQQHRHLVDLLNKLAGTLVSGDVSAVNSAFDALAAYANKHFEDEEVIWQDCFAGDAWMSSHQMAHATFLPKVVELKDHQADRPLSDVVEQLVKFLIRWLAFHIIDNDKRMAMVVAATSSGIPIEQAKNLADRQMSGSMRVLIETVLSMYDTLSSRALELLRERRARIAAEQKLIEANRRLMALSVTDQLTSLYNRRHLDSTFDREVRRARRDGARLTYYLIDVDHFKSINDNFGHLRGDEVLVAVAQKLQQLCRRPGDFVFRVGGEEFAVLVTEDGGSAACEFGETIRASIEQMRVPYEAGAASRFMTVSIGAVSRVPGVQDSLDDYTRTADSLLYRAKTLGRNRVASAE